MIYVFITSFLFFIRYLLRNTIFERNLIYYLIFITLFIFVAFRYQVGCDWTTYESLFYSINQYEWSKILGISDPFFWLINGLLYNLNLSFISLNVVFATIFFWGIHRLAKHQPDPLSFLILIYPILIINMPMSGIRQGAAIGLVCIALVHFIDCRPIKFLTWVLLATGFHLSAIVFLLLLPFSTGRYNNTRLSILFIMILPCLIFIYLSSGALRAFDMYIGSGREAYGAFFRIFILALSAIYFFLCVKEKWKKNFSEDYNIVSLGSIGMLLLLLILPISTIISDRFGYYLIPIQAMIFARLPFLPFKSYHSLNIALPYFGLFIIFLVWTLTSWHFQKCYIPYSNWIIN